MIISSDFIGKHFSFLNRKGWVIVGDIKSLDEPSFHEEKFLKATVIAPSRNNRVFLPKMLFEEV